MSMAVSTLAIEEEIPEVEKGSSSSSSTPVPSAKRVIQRPTFVQLPSPRTFSIETQMPPISPSATYTPAIGSSYSTSSTSPLAMFDANYARGSPSSLNAGMSFESVGMPVLVVDDDPLTRTLMKKILTRLGCQVSCAENGEVALEMILGRRISIPVSTPSSDYSMTREMKPILEQEVSPHRSTCASTPPGPSDEYKYAVIFLDNQMPKMSGLKVVAKLRELERKDFVVGVTGTLLTAAVLNSL
jgi:CheY-like chemotaxis protein